jgi:hypothetical protein
MRASSIPTGSATERKFSRLLHLLGSAGLWRAEAANLLVGDVDERRRASDGRPAAPQPLRFCVRSALTSVRRQA